MPRIMDSVFAARRLTLSLPAADAAPLTCPLSSGYVPFRRDTSPFFGIRPLPPGYVPFSYTFSRERHKIRYKPSETEVCPMEMKLPYYMMYPTPFLFDDDKIEERDYAYVRSMYPETAKRILPFVEEECDRMEYEGSMIYDEYPDRLQLRLMCRRIFDRVMEEEDLIEMEELTGTEKRLTGMKENLNGMEKAQIEAEQRPGRPDGRGRGRRRQDNVRDLIELLLYQELLRRRGSDRRRRRRRIW